ncbi:hypothetical protein K8R14_03940 [bacterium]|nr:hypothetical protein [bacterium]
MKHKKILIVLAIILIALFVIIIPSSDKKNKKNEITYTITTDDTEIFGEATVEESGQVYVQYSFILNDSNINRNGVCVDLEGDWCEELAHHGPEEIKYHYTANFVSSEDPSQVHATDLQEVYCNEEALKKNPFDTSIDLYCGQEMLDWNLWEPTSTFLLRNGTSFASMEEFLAVDTLHIYDTSKMHRIINTYDEETYTGTLSTESRTYEEHIAECSIVQTYSVSFEREE